MKSIVFALITTALLLPFASVFGKSITIDVSDIVSYDHIRTYSDGVTVVSTPKLYGLYLADSNVDSSKTTALVFCKKIGMKYYGKVGTSLSKLKNTISYDHEDGLIVGPHFSSGNLVLSRVICRR